MLSEVGVAVEVAGASSIRSAVAWASMTRSRSWAIASATAARCSAATSRERSASSSSRRVSAGALPPPAGGCMVGAMRGSSGGGVVAGMRPKLTSAVIGIRHPAGVAIAPASSRSPRLRRSVETEMPQALAASARPSTGPSEEGCMAPIMTDNGGVSSYVVCCQWYIEGAL